MRFFRYIIKNILTIFCLKSWNVSNRFFRFPGKRHIRARFDLIFLCLVVLKLFKTLCIKLPYFIYSQKKTRYIYKENFLFNHREFIEISNPSSQTEMQREFPLKELETFSMDHMYREIHGRNNIRNEQLQTRGIPCDDRIYLVSIVDPSRESIVVSRFESRPSGC